jgi:copper(I)-binding protein
LKTLKGKHTMTKNFQRRLTRLCLLGLGSLIALAAQAHGFDVGDLFVRHPYASPSLEGVKNGAVYFKAIKNNGKLNDQLIFARTDVAQSVQLHEMHMDNNVMRMKEMAAIDIAAGAEVSMVKGNPNGYHLMLLGLKQVLKDGDRFPLWLTFKHAGEVKVEVYVQTPKAAAQPEEHKH